MSYVDGFVVPLPRKNVAAYKKIAKVACKIWLDHGALEYRECLGDDLAIPGVASFLTGIKLKKGETVVFAWIRYKSKKHRDAVNKKVMKDPRLICDPKKMPFDCSRMLYGGFKAIVESGT